MTYVRYYKESDRQAWDAYVYRHPDSYHAHLIGWKDVIEQTYHKKPYYLIAEDNDIIEGVLPLFHIKSRIFGNQLVSMPYLTYGGIIADSNDIAKDLINKALKIAKELGAVLELRQVNPLDENSYDSKKTKINTTKVSMRLDLPENSDALFKSFKAKLRSQIRRPQKEGMVFKLGGREFIDDFYKVFAVNMRALGSPVHSKKLFVELFNRLEDTAKIGVVFFNRIPVASGIITLFNKYVEIPWASTIRKYNRFSPNMLLYWGLFEYVTNGEYKIFDFGRSAIGKATYKFKKQWGSQPITLNWYSNESHKDSTIGYKKNIFINIWCNLPLFLTNTIGPYVRKSITL